jgi:hypothetical protein
VKEISANLRAFIANLQLPKGGIDALQAKIEREKHLLERRKRSLEVFPH